LGAPLAAFAAGVAPGPNPSNASASKKPGSFVLRTGAVSVGEGWPLTGLQRLIFSQRKRVRSIALRSVPLHRSATRSADGGEKTAQKGEPKMSTYKRGGVWWFRFKFQGQTIRESSKSGSRTIARDAERARRRELEVGINRLGPRRDPMPLFRLAAQRWLAEKAGRAPKTISGYTERTAPLVKAFGDRLVCDVTRGEILGYRSKRLTEGFSPRTVNMEMGCLRGILDGHGLWAGVSRKITRLKENRDAGRALSYEDEDILRGLAGQSLAPSLLPLFVMAIDSGLRASELKSIQRKDLVLTISADGSITAGEVVVPKSKTEAGRGRSIPLTARVCAVLTTWLARFPDAKPTSYIFPRHSVRMLRGGTLAVISDVELSKPVRSWYRAWRKVLRDAKLYYRWHDLRHSFVTRLAENPNVSEETIRALAGHVSKEMLSRYSHIRVKAKREAITALERDRIENSAGGGTKVGTILTEREGAESQVTENIWLPPRDSNPDNLLQRQVS
jgi:integrase